MRSFANAVEIAAVVLARRVPLFGHFSALVLKIGVIFLVRRHRLKEIFEDPRLVGLVGLVVAIATVVPECEIITASTLVLMNDGRKRFACGSETRVMTISSISKRLYRMKSR